MSIRVAVMVFPFFAPKKKKPLFLHDQRNWGFPEIDFFHLSVELVSPKTKKWRCS
jgi:hypothetical protein